jgi:hypothetical protein
VDANHCVPVIGDKTFGEPCERFEDNDDCDKGLFCMTKTSGGTGEGVCFEFCVPNDPNSCQLGGECQANNDGVLPLCETDCDPLEQDCSPGMGCYGAFETFICTPPTHEDGKGNDGDECHAIQSCMPGLTCASDHATADCTHDRCCTPFCAITGPETQCPEPTEECVAWFEEGQAPVGLEDVGYCGLP